MKLIDGRAVASALEADIAVTAAGLRSGGVEPTLAVVVPTDDEATAWYVRSIERAATRVGVACRVYDLAGSDITTLRQELRRLAADPSVHGIVCQTPLPPGAALAQVAADIPPEKDVDGANPLSLGRLAAGLPAFPPATAAAVMELLRAEAVGLSGAHVVVIGRSIVVGKPAALLLLAENATVTVCHSRTRDLAAVCVQADVLVAAAGRAGLVTADFVRPGAVVIDVGTNPTPDGTLVGDVDASAAGHAGALTPVPGGVGPVTAMVLMRHVIDAATARHGR